MIIAKLNILCPSPLPTLAPISASFSPPVFIVFFPLPPIIPSHCHTLPLKQVLNNQVSWNNYFKARYFSFLFEKGAILVSAETCILTCPLGSETSTSNETLCCWEIKAFILLHNNTVRNINILSNSIDLNRQIDKSGLKLRLKMVKP